MDSLVKSGLRGGAAGVLALLLAAGSAAIPALAAPSGAEQKPAQADPNHLFGHYLAGRSAQQTRDFTSASSWYAKAITGDSEAPELISRTFLMEVCVGHFDRARALAPK